MVGGGLEGRALGGLARQRVLNDGVARARLAQLPAQLLILRHRQLLEADEHPDGRRLELLREGFEVSLLLLSGLHNSLKPSPHLA